MTRRQTAKALTEIDAQITALRAIEAQFAALPATGIDEVGDAWNSTHDAIEALEAHRRWVEQGAPAQTGTWALIQANID